jgi:DNA-binding LacI/PurR family transcriptional regulator
MKTSTSLKKKGIAHRGSVVIADVARASKCSITTVSHVMNRIVHARVSNETRMRVEQAVRELGYQPNRMGRALASSKTMLIGLVTDYGPGDFPNETSQLEIIAGVQSVLCDAEYDLVLIHRQKSESWARSSGVDGAILLSPRSNADISIFTASGLPIVVMEPSFRVGVSSVGVDEAYAVGQALEHLIELGHRRIAFIGPKSDTSCMGLRTEAYFSIMREHGLEPMNELLFGDDPSILCQLLDAVPEIVRAEGITGILAMTDGLGIRAMNRLRLASIIAPRDISIIGIDGTVASQISIPPLSTVRNPVQERGERAAHMLMGLIRNPRQPVEHVVFAVSLIRRESTAPLSQTKLL